MKKKRRSTKRVRTRKTGSRGTLFLILIIAFILGTCLLYFVLPKNGRIADNGETLQLGTFKPTTPPPPPVEAPGTACNHDNGQPAQVNNGQPVTDPSCTCIAWLIECKDKRCVSHNNPGQGPEMSKDCEDQLVVGPGTRLFDLWCSSPGLANGDGVFCIGKPVIYLYPEKPTFVDVEVRTTGDIFVSDPLYPEGGWKNVYAEPSGKLTYQGGTYKELFYESNVKDFGKPTTGLTIRKATLEVQLDDAITRLGLVGAEKTEFLEWWVPRLHALNSEYIQFSLIDPIEKEKIDHVSYNPEPDTRIEFIAYFKPLKKPYQGEELVLPATPPKRIGFTAVEWGGTIDYGK